MKISIKLFLTLVFFISLISLMGAYTCNMNTIIEGHYYGETNPWPRVELKSYLLSDQTKYIQQTVAYNLEEQMLITTTNSGGKIIKNSSLVLGFRQIDSEGYENTADEDRYFIVNENYLKQFITNNICDTYGPCSNNQVTTIYNRLKTWFGTNTQTPKSNEFAERVFIYAEDANFINSTNPSADSEFTIITKPFYMPYTKVNGNSTNLNMKKTGISVYDYETIVEQDDTALSKIDLTMQVMIMQQVQDYPTAY